MGYKVRALTRIEKKTHNKKEYPVTEQGAANNLRVVFLGKRFNQNGVIMFWFITVNVCFVSFWHCPVEKCLCSGWTVKVSYKNHVHAEERTN